MAGYKNNNYKGKGNGKKKFDKKYKHKPGTVNPIIDIQEKLFNELKDKSKILEISMKTGKSYQGVFIKQTTFEILIKLGKKLFDINKSYIKYFTVEDFSIDIKNQLLTDITGLKLKSKPSVELILSDDTTVEFEWLAEDKFVLIGKMNGSDNITVVFKHAIQVIK